MNHQYESYDDADGTPKQIQDSVVQSDVFFSVDGTLSCNEHLRFVEGVPKANFLAVQFWPATPGLERFGGGFKCDGCEADGSDQMLSIFQKRSDDRLGSIVGIGHEVIGDSQAQRT